MNGPLPPLARVALSVDELTPGRPVVVRSVLGHRHRATVRGGHRFADGTPGVLVELASGARLTVRLGDVWPEVAP